MYIVVLSDTHIPKKAKTIPAAMEDDLERADLIIHAGDWQIPAVAAELEKYAPLEGVTGNVDSREMQSMFPRTKKLEIDGFLIGITHGDGKGKTTEKRAVEAFKDTDIDLVIFGHSHIPVLHRNNQLIIFNPGSPTDKRRQTHYSYGIIETGSDLHIRHVYFDTK